jgi:hypothetical protein
MITDALSVYVDFVSWLDLAGSRDVDHFKEPIAPARADLAAWDRISVLRHWV